VRMRLVGARRPGHAMAQQHARLRASPAGAALSPRFAAVSLGLTLRVDDGERDGRGLRTFSALVDYMVLSLESLPCTNYTYGGVYMHPSSISWVANKCAARSARTHTRPPRIA
jgi:hypothetical protein